MQIREGWWAPLLIGCRRRPGLGLVAKQRSWISICSNEVGIGGVEDRPLTLILGLLLLPEELVIVRTHHEGQYELGHESGEDNQESYFDDS